ncbi:MAG TPA: hypothetical protein QF838_08335 [SAR202 cluster bacterium]|nr:hypothetical protein [SAR202 cluster bacterium]
MSRLKNIRLVLAGAFIVPVALASIACSPIYADDPNGVQREIIAPDLDLEALNARIQSAVESGEISQAQVATAIEILKSEFSVTPKTRFKPFMGIEKIKAEILAAVESGEITQEEADAKLAGLEERKERGQMPHGKRHHHKKPFMGIQDIRAKISAAVESGEITQEEADEKLADIEAKRNAGQEKMDAKLESIKAEILAAVESGEITQEEADAKLAGLEERKEKGQKWHGKRHHHKKPFMGIEEIKAKILAAVESGEITQGQGQDKLRYFKDGPKKVIY